MPQGIQLPADTSSFSNQSSNGFATPHQDTSPQVFTALPKQVIPIVFLPGIMGSNLIISDAQRVGQLKQSDNISWRPDTYGATNAHALATQTAAQRQLRLDPNATAVDVYSPGGGNISGDGRNNNVELASGFSSPLLAKDVPGTSNAQSANQRARMRGWGEVFFKSYGEVLQRMEQQLNSTFSKGQIAAAWTNVVGTDPAKWGAVDVPGKEKMQVLTEADLKKFATGRWFPVHAIGYNWLQSNGKSAIAAATRIKSIVDAYRAAKFDCPGVVIVTHSMGGLTSRAVIHPDYGNIKDLVLGMVHSVQPAIGAGAAYKRIRAGFDDPGMTLLSQSQMTTSITAKIAGNYGNEVTAVLANSPGGLQLLPTTAYGKGWLRITHQGKVVASLPQSDPFEEIYKIKGKWYSLFREEWINPAGLEPAKSSFQRTCVYLDDAKRFHEKISEYYHDVCYAHYGNDPQHLCFGDVVWDISRNCSTPAGWETWPILYDSRQGVLELLRWNPFGPNPNFGPSPGASTPAPITASIQPPTEPGDETVPVRSADDQLKSKKFSGIFRQTGYDHQGSYMNETVLRATLYCVTQIVLRRVK